LVDYGVVFRPQSDPRQLTEVVRAAEAAGVSELWLWEDCFLETGPSMAAVALASSTHLHVGIGLMPAPLRNAALAAMEVATLAHLFPGRLTVAFGQGVAQWMHQVGAAVDSPLTLLREYTTAVQRLLRGESLDVEGRYVQLSGVRLDRPPESPPRILIGGRGPRTVALAGELTDGVLLDSVADAAAVARARELVGPAAHIAVYTEVRPDEVADRCDELGSAGADTVIVQAGSESPDPHPLIDGLRGLVGREGQ
jgi:alkanesulfonate monooxygenase SsuD/methylene tetrahydromethanopterin reductase-like flavin-dependent oxidoreductase (luciferase family)